MTPESIRVHNKLCCPRCCYHSYTLHAPRMLLHTGRYVLSGQFNLQSTRTQSLLLVVSELVVQVGELRGPSLFEAQPLQKNNTTCCASLVNITAALLRIGRAQKEALCQSFSRPRRFNSLRSQ